MAQVSMEKASPTGVFGLTACTLEFWVYPTTAANDDFLVWCGTVSSNSNISFGCRFSGSPVKINARVAVGGTAYDITGATTMSNNTWYHVSLVYNGATISLNIGTTGADDASDGTPVAATGTLNTPDASNDSLFIGAVGTINESTVGNHAAAIIDEVRIWNVARNLGDINNTKYSELTLLESGLVNVWRMNDGSGATATDSKGSNNFTLTGSPTWSTTLPFATYTDGSSTGGFIFMTS